MHQEIYNNSPLATALKSSSHPTALIFHFLFKILAIFSYFLTWFFSGSFVLTFVFTVVLSALDFWAVKNVTGRLLVGLRWWNDVQPDGSNVWVYESSRSSPNDPFQQNATDYRAFWWALYLFASLWMLLSFTALIQLHFEWLMLPLVALFLIMANLVGYIRCDKDSRKHLVNHIGVSFLGTAFQKQVAAFLNSSPPPPPTSEKQFPDPYNVPSTNNVDMPNIQLK